MKKILKYLFVSAVLIFLNSCSKDDVYEVKQENNIVGKWEFKKIITYNELNQEVYQDYNHACSSSKDYIQLSANNLFVSSHATSDCIVENESKSYTYTDNIIRLYSGEIQATYQIKIVSLSDTELKLKYENSSTSPTGKSGADTYLLIRK